MFKGLARFVAVFLSVIAIAGGLVFGAFLWIDSQEEPTGSVSADSQEDSQVSDRVEEKDEQVEVLKEESIKQNDDMKKDDKPFSNIYEWDDDTVQTLIHRMSHQKVKADEKRGFILMTDEKINTLLEKIEYQGLEHEDTYREILEEWKQGDFSNVVEHHNTIWELQDGKVGKAHGRLSEHEEQAYISAYANPPMEKGKGKSFLNADEFMLYIDSTSSKMMSDSEYDSIDDFIAQAKKDVDRGIGADYETQIEIGNHIARYGVHFFSSTGEQIRVYLKGLVREAMPFHEDSERLSDEERKKEFRELYELVNKYDEY
ncbi:MULTISPECIES: DUF6241 domain-containing protein [Allobacillus]|uniref:Uncharacterized protein n=1 Tax=Allobacillus salarius TaxID=1955272 RepID=A0A556PSZ0_9BACI|nr:DUF6241 domain-containing protein [Allobacillus salarius]TSJ67494.1 hypothetical protein FPQ13_00030 [Allobacillus salarius]